jgi:hypothetical protein
MFVDSEQKDMEPQDEFERELRQAFARRPAPPSLKRKLMQTRRTKRKPLAWFTWQRLAASLVLTAILAGGIAWRQLEERRQEEAAREQVFTALRVTSHALNQMNSRLAAHSRAATED